MIKKYKKGIKKVKVYTKKYLQLLNKKRVKKSPKRYIKKKTIKKDIFIFEDYVDLFIPVPVESKAKLKYIDDITDRKHQTQLWLLKHLRIKEIEGIQFFTGNLNYVPQYIIDNFIKCNFYVKIILFNFKNESILSTKIDYYISSIDKLTDYMEKYEIEYSQIKSIKILVLKDW